MQDVKELQKKIQDLEENNEKMNLMLEQEQVKDTLSHDREFNYQFILRLDAQNKQLNSIAQQLYQISEILSKFIPQEEEEEPEPKK